MAWSATPLAFPSPTVFGSAVSSGFPHSKVLANGKVAFAEQRFVTVGGIRQGVILMIADLTDFSTEYINFPLESPEQGTFLSIDEFSGFGNHVTIASYFDISFSRLFFFAKVDGGGWKKFSVGFSSSGGTVGCLGLFAGQLYFERFLPATGGGGGWTYGISSINIVEMILNNTSAVWTARYTKHNIGGPIGVSAVLGQRAGRRPDGSGVLWVMVGADTYTLADPIISPQFTFAGIGTNGAISVFNDGSRFIDPAPLITATPGGIDAPYGVWDQILFPKVNIVDKYDSRKVLSYFTSTAPVDKGRAAFSGNTIGGSNNYWSQGAMARDYLQNLFFTPNVIGSELVLQYFSKVGDDPSGSVLTTWQSLADNVTWNDETEELILSASFAPYTPEEVLAYPHDESRPFMFYAAASGWPLIIAARPGAVDGFWILSQESFYTGYTTRYVEWFLENDRDIKLGRGLFAVPLEKNSLSTIVTPVNTSELEYDYYNPGSVSYSIEEDFPGVYDGFSGTVYGTIFRVGDSLYMTETNRDPTPSGATTLLEYTGSNTESIGYIL